MRLSQRERFSRVAASGLARPTRSGRALARESSPRADSATRNERPITSPIHPWRHTRVKQRRHRFLPTPRAPPRRYLRRAYRPLLRVGQLRARGMRGGLSERETGRAGERGGATEEGANAAALPSSTSAAAAATASIHASPDAPRAPT